MSTCILHKKTHLQTWFFGVSALNFSEVQNYQETWGEMTIPYTLENLNIEPQTLKFKHIQFSSAARKNGPLLNHVWQSLIMTTTHFASCFPLLILGVYHHLALGSWTGQPTACDSRFCKRLHSQRARSRSSWMVLACELSVRHVTPTSLEGANRWESICLICIFLCSTWVAQHYVHK